MLIGLRGMGLRCLLLTLYIDRICLFPIPSIKMEDIMYRLMISHDCGMSYSCEKKSENVDDFKEDCKKLDEQMLRWCIEEDGKLDMNHTCLIHKSILRMFTPPEEVT